MGWGQGGRRIPDPLLPLFSLAEDPSHGDLTSPQSHILGKKGYNYQSLLWASPGSRMEQASLLGAVCEQLNPKSTHWPSYPILEGFSPTLPSDALSNWANHSPFPSFFSLVREDIEREDVHRFLHH